MIREPELAEVVIQKERRIFLLNTTNIEGPRINESVLNEKLKEISTNFQFSLYSDVVNFVKEYTSDKINRKG